MTDHNKGNQKNAEYFFPFRYRIRNISYFELLAIFLEDDSVFLSWSRRQS
jgi:hypothetical protein